MDARKISPLEMYFFPSPACNDNYIIRNILVYYEDEHLQFCALDVS